MKINEIITEVQLGPGGTVNTQQYGSSTVDQRGPGVSLPRDDRGVPIEPGLEPSPIGPEDLIGLGSSSLARNVAKGAARAIPKRGAAELVSDFKNVPSIYKPWTYGKIGRVSADDMADQAFKQQHGKPFNPWEWTADEVRSFEKFKNDFVNRGYQPKPQQVQIGSNLSEPGYHQFHNKNPHTPGTPDFKKWDSEAKNYERLYHQEYKLPTPKYYADKATTDSLQRSAITTAAELSARAGRSNNSQEQQSTDSKK
jgi:hypothetical protein